MIMRVIDDGDDFDDRLPQPEPGPDAAIRGNDGWNPLNGSQSLTNIDVPHAIAAPAYMARTKQRTTVHNASQPLFDQ